MSLTMVRRRSMADLRQLLPMALLAVAVMLSGLLPALTPQPVALPSAQPISPDTAIDLAIAPVRGDRPEERIALFAADYAPGGITFQPRFGGAAWRWSLVAVSAGASPLAGVSTGAVVPALANGGADYHRGAIVERYIERSNAAIEQQFIIPSPLALNGQDLTIRGAISAFGSFSAVEGGWEWRTDEGVVTLGDVFVYDASGAELPATMQVTADSTMITVDGAALAAAAYPVTVDPLIGTNDFAVTNRSGLSGNLYDAFEPAVAFDPVLNRYLVVFSADGPVDSNPLLQRLDDEFEIYGQFVNASTGALDGAPFRISRNGIDTPNAQFPNTNDFADAISPDIAYSTRDNLFLVAWVADNGNPTGEGRNAANAFETYTQVVSYTGELLIREDGDDPATPEVETRRPKDDRISTILAFNFRTDVPDDAVVGTVIPDWDAFSPSVAYNSANGDFLVCWSDDRNTVIPLTYAELLGGEYEIRCKRFIIDPPANNSRPFFGAEPPDAPVTISSMSGHENTARREFDAYSPDIAYNSVDNQYLVVWSGDQDSARLPAEPNTGVLVDNEFEIFGQVLNASMTEMHTLDAAYRNDHRFTQVGEATGCAGDGCDAYFPAVAHNPDRNHYLVAFTADNVNGNEEVFYSLRTANGASPTNGVLLTQISQMGGSGTSGTAANLDGIEPDVAYDAARREWMVIWRGDNTTDDVFQIYGQRLNAATPTDAQLTPSSNTTPISEVGDTDFLMGNTRTLLANGTANSFNGQGLFSKHLVSAPAASAASTDGSIVFDGAPQFARMSLAPAIAATGRGDYLAVWTGNLTTNNTGNGTQVRMDIRGRLMTFEEIPVVTPPANITAEATGPSGAVVTYTNATANDAEDGPLTATCLPASGSTFPLGVNTVTCTAADRFGKIGTATFTITVQDTARPVITSPGNQTAEATGPSGAPVTFTPSSFDLVDSNVPVTCTSAPTAGLGSGSTFPLGVTTMTCNASDDSGNNADPVEFTVTVQDTTGPAITVPANISTEATSPAGAVVTYTAPSASDLVSGTAAVTCTSAPTAGLSSGSTFPVGVTTITCTASDAADNDSSESFTVTVGAFNAQANLSLSRSLTPNPVLAGADLTASFTIANAGPQAATGVQLTVPVPNSVTFKSGSNGCELSGSNVVCAVGTIANGGSTTVTIVFTVKANTTGNVSISGTVDAAESDPVPTNNTGSGSVSVTPAQAQNKIYLPLLRR